MRQPIWTRAVSEKGGGRKKLIEVSAALEENFLKVLEDHTAGDPMRADVKWTNLSRGEIASRVTEWELKSVGTSFPSCSANTSTASERH